MERHEVQLFDTAELLEATSHNAYLDGMLRKVEEVEELISHAETDRRERAAFIQDLDDNWAYMGQEIVASGIVMTQTEHSTVLVPDYARQYREEQQLISNGFVMVPFTSTMDDEAITVYKIAYSFKLQGHDVCMLRNECVADFPNNTVEAAERRLLYFHNEELVKIQQLLESHQSGAEPLLALADYTLNVWQHDKYGKNYVADMERYLNDVIICDNALPYMARLDGEVYEKTQAGYSLVASSAKDLLVKPDGVHLFPSNLSAEDKSAIYEPYVELSVFHADHNKENTTLFVRVNQLEYFVPIRLRFK